MLDFDGTITEDDLLDRIAREFGDPAVYQEVEDGLHAGTITLQECITREYEPVTLPLDEAVAWVLERVRVRPGLPELVAFARERGWNVSVLSSGFEEMIRPVLAAAGVDGVDVFANSIDARPDGWRVQWRDERSAPSAARRASEPGCPRRRGRLRRRRHLRSLCRPRRRSSVRHARPRPLLRRARAAYEPFDDFHDIVRALRARLNACT